MENEDMKAINEHEAKAIEFCIFATNEELEQAYSRASMHGNGKVCDIILAEMDRRAICSVKAVGLRCL